MFQSLKSPSRQFFIFCSVTTFMTYTMAPSTVSYGTLPHDVQGKIEKFELHVEEQQVRDFKQLVRLSPVAKECYENRGEGHNGLGVTRAWMLEAKAYWESEFDWYLFSPFHILPPSTRIDNWQA